MRQAFKKWIEKLASEGSAFRNNQHLLDEYFYAWLTEASSALAAVFPSGHPVQVAWEQAVKEARVNPSDYYYIPVGVFRGAAILVRDDRLETLIDAVRAETEEEILEQAEHLLDKKYLVAATVLAGGALETHLRRYVDKNGLTFAGDGSITSYNDAVARARKTQPDAYYSLSDGKQVTAWGGLRNDAAHRPGEFKATADDVRRMIEGVRSFIVRVA